MNNIQRNRTDATSKSCSAPNSATGGDCNHHLPCAPYLTAHILSIQDVENLNYASDATVLFQRLTVMATELLLLCATLAATKSLPQERRWLATFLIAANPGLIIVDHIHFQYNGVLLGIFLLSIWTTASGAEVAGAALFAALLCSKHIFLYAAPAFFVYLLRYYCRGTNAVPRFITLGATVAGVAGIALGPFLAAGHARQLLSRMFPVSRGLLHAYWAPNFWALYAGADKASTTVLRLLGLGSLLPPAAERAVLTGGLVGEAPFSLMPNVTSGMAAMCTLVAMVPGLATCWRRPLPGRFARCVIYCTLCSFVFGYHVHEKAVLMVLVPLVLLAAGGKDGEAPREFAFLTAVGTYSLFPLLIRTEEYGIKVLLLVVYLLVAVPWLRDPGYWTHALADDDEAVAKKESKKAVKSTDASSSSSGSGGGPKRAQRSRRGRPPLVPAWEAAYLWGLVPLELYCAIGHRALLGGRLPFLPLMITSLYCAAGVVYCWSRMALRYCMELGWVLAAPAPHVDGKKYAPSADALVNNAHSVPRKTSASASAREPGATRPRRRAPRD